MHHKRRSAGGGGNGDEVHTVHRIGNDFGHLLVTEKNESVSLGLHDHECECHEPIG
jgi:hypothetical protein